MTEDVVFRRGEISGELRCQRAWFEKGREVFFQRLVIGEGEMFGVFFEKEVEGVVNGHFHDEFDLHAELLHLIREDEPRVPVRERVLVPVDEVFAARDSLRVAEDLRPAMRRGAKSYDVRPMADRLAVSVMRFMVKGGVDGHGYKSEIRMPKSEGWCCWGSFKNYCVCDCD